METKRRKSMRKTGIIFAAIIFAFVASNSAFAWGPGKGKCPNQGANWGDGKGQYEWGVKLTDEQKQQMKELHDKFVDDTADLRININSKSEKIRILMETSEPDAGELKSLVKDVADLKGQLTVKRVDFYLDAKKIAPDVRMGRWLHGGDKRGMGHGFHGKGGPGEFCGRN
jgi:zinc resistance-associated protein